MFRYALIIILAGLLNLPAQAATIRISPMGDSITLGQTSVSNGRGVPGYRQPLWDLMQTLGDSIQVDFQGRYTSLFDANFDQDHDAIKGAKVYDLLTTINAWDQGPDIVLLQAGFEDLLLGRNQLDIIADLRRVIDAMRQVNANIIIYLGEIYPISSLPQGYSTSLHVPTAEAYANFNALLSTVAAQELTNISPVIVVEHASDFNASTDLLSDGLHLTQVASTRMAQRWFDKMVSTPAVVKLLSAGEEVTGEGSLITQSYTLSTISRLNVDGNFAVTVSRSDQQNVQVSAYANWLSYIQLQVSGETLNISLRDGFVLPSTVNINIQMADFNGLELTGDAQVSTTDMFSEKLTLVLSEQAQFTATNNVILRLDATVSGTAVGNLSASSIRHAQIAMGGDGQLSLRMNGQGALTGTLQDQAILNLIGTPSSTQLNQESTTQLIKTEWDPGVVPIAAFTADTSSLLSVNLDASTTYDPDGKEILQYSWSSSDGQTASGKTASFSYASARSYNITLSVLDAEGLSGSTQKLVTINDESSTSCTYTLSPLSASYAVSGGIGKISITTGTTCTWSAASLNQDWLTVLQGSSNIGYGEVYYQLSANTASTSRTGILRIAEQEIRIEQAGTESTACSYEISPLETQFDLGSGFGSIQITTNDNCAWTVETYADWIGLLHEGSGQGSATIPYFVSKNLDCGGSLPCDSSNSAATPDRSGYIYAAEQRVLIQQTGTAGITCVYQLSPVLGQVSASASSAVVNVTAPDGCPWTASSPVNWIQISAGSSGTGSGTVVYGVSPNTCIEPDCQAGDDNSRSAILSVAGQGFPVYQESTPNPCSYSFSPSSLNIAATSTGGQIQISTGDNCSWELASSADWLRITQGASGQGNGSFLYEIDPNLICVGTPCSSLAGSARRGWFSIGSDASLQVDQASSRTDCTFTLSPAARWHTASPSVSYINISASPSDCAWAADNANAANWINLEGETSGQGSGRIRYSLVENLSVCSTEPCPAPAAERSSYLFVAGQEFAINQAAESLYPTLSPSQPRFRRGQTVIVEIPERTIGFAHYLAIGLPDSGQLYLITNTNQLVPYDGSQVLPWEVDSYAAGTALAWTVSDDLPVGEYWLYLLPLQVGLAPLEYVDYWKLGVSSFSIVE